MQTRRAFLEGLSRAAVVPVLLGTSPRRASMRLALHQNTSRAAGFRGSLEGWSRAGISEVELSDALLDRFLDGDTLPGAFALLSDLGLTPVSGAAVLGDLWIPGPARARSLESWRRRCDQYAALRLRRIYAPSFTSRALTPEDRAGEADAIRETGEIARGSGLEAMIEFTRTSTHLSTLTDTLRAIREAGHPAVRPMLDLFHFWSGTGDLAELDGLRPGELAHVHFQDTAEGPRDAMNNGSRRLPGDGVAPLRSILEALNGLGYGGALSVELLQGDLTRRDPFDLATEARSKGERVMRAAGVLAGGRNSVWRGLVRDIR